VVFDPSGGPRTNCSDDLLWLPFILDAYLKETDDYSILDEMIPFLNGPAVSLYEHCKRAIERSFSRFSSAATMNNGIFIFA
jgi:cellobiose phosphorylase